MKKILAGVLAAASMLSVSAVAFAADNETNLTTGAHTYEVTAAFSAGTVDVTLPTELDGSIFFNPYGSPVKTGSVSNTGAVASPVYTIKNNDGTDGIKVMVTPSVVTATGLTVVDPRATNANITNYNPLVTYDKNGDPVDAAKQAKNIAVWVSADTTQAGAVVSSFDGDKCVPFILKNTASYKLLELAASASGYFTLGGELNPQLPEGGAGVAWTEKEALKLKMVFKVMPKVTA